jgi:hypothetical protein
MFSRFGNSLCGMAQQIKCYQMFFAACGFCGAQTGQFDPWLAAHGWGVDKLSGVQKLRDLLWFIQRRKSESLPGAQAAKKRALRGGAQGPRCAGK